MPDLTVEGRFVFGDALDEMGTHVGTADRLLVSGVVYYTAAVAALKRFVLSRF